MPNPVLRGSPIWENGGSAILACHCRWTETWCNKAIPPPVRRDLSEIIRESIEYGLTQREEAVAYSLAYARDMNRQLAGKFIGMYVNEFTRDYGEVGRAAIRKFLAEAHKKGYIGVPIAVEFVE